jgi:hypothetical protein
MLDKSSGSCANIRHTVRILPVLPAAARSSASSSLIPFPAATFESSALFYAGLCLYVYSRSLLTVQITSTSESPPDKGTPFPLDSDLQAADAPDTGSWLALGGPASLSDLSLTISSNRESSGVSVQVLRSVSQHLTQVATIWRIGQVFAVVLDNLVRRDEAAAARMATFDSAAAAAFG